MSLPTNQTLVEAEARKVCERGHAMGWRPWYRSRVSGKVLGHCLCGAPYRLETRGPRPMVKQGLVAAEDWVTLEFPDLDERAERIAKVAVRAYLNVLDEAPDLRGQSTDAD